MIPWFSLNHNVAGSDMSSKIYLTVVYKQNYVLQKIKVKQRLVEEQD